LLVKHARHTDTHEMMWRRGKIHSIDFKQWVAFIFLIYFN
jgi:hypothetical protein